MGVIEFRAIGGGGFSKNGTVQHFDEALVSFFLLKICRLNMKMFGKVLP